MFNPPDFIKHFEINAENFESIYDEGEHPSELLQSINNKLDKQQEIINELQKQYDFNKQEATSAKKSGKKATIISIIGIVIAIATLAYEIVSSFLF